MTRRRGEGGEVGEEGEEGVLQRVKTTNAMK
jgi:hypothetical protein